VNISQAIELLRAVESSVNEGDTPVKSLHNLDKLSRSNTVFHASIRLGPACQNWAARWYKDLHKNPAVYMYQLCGGYDNFIEYKYTLRRGNKSKEVPEVILRREIEEFRTYPKNVNGEYEHHIPNIMTYSGDNYE
jgi:hypothetical protein